MKYRTIKQEALACRKAMKNAKSGDLVWFCHHETPIEILTEPPSNRINFILNNKNKNEKAIRLHWFRPLTIKLPSYLTKAEAEWQKAEAQREKADAEWQRQKADAEWQKILQIHSKHINALIKKHLPDCPWDGTSLV